jgi:hypothetical protein
MVVTLISNHIHQTTTTSFPTSPKNSRRVGQLLSATSHFTIRVGIDFLPASEHGVSQRTQPAMSASTAQQAPAQKGQGQPVLVLPSIFMILTRLGPQSTYRPHTQTTRTVCSRSLRESATSSRRQRSTSESAQDPSPPSICPSRFQVPNGLPPGLGESTTPSPHMSHVHVIISAVSYGISHMMSPRATSPPWKSL